MRSFTKFQNPIKSTIFLSLLFCFSFILPYNANALSIGNLEDCEATTGALIPINSNECFQGKNEIYAKPDGNANVPKGFSLLYVLTQGTDLVIQAVSDQPNFTVTEGGLFTIHTFVFPSDLDLSIVEIGVTTGFDVNSLLIQGGGQVCAALDVAGAQFNLSNPSAGTLTANEASVSLSNGTATISATPNGDSNIPEGFSSLFVLTQGDGLVISNVATEPSFEVTEAGSYTIHTFVFPSDLDLSGVEIGVTTGFDVFGLIVPGGGQICADLDVKGAPITVEEEPCLADAGMIKSLNPDICFSGSAKILASASGAVVPEGYSVLYVLTKGNDLVIQQVSNAPGFTVTEGGLFTIHTFVFPSDLDLSIVEFGVTTGFDVNSLLIQGGGELCAALDVAGAQFTVANPFAGTLTADESTVTLSDGSATISATPNGDVNVPEGYSSIFVLTQGEELVIVNVGGEPNFEVTEAGNYTIHTFVFPSNLDLSIVELGVTTGFDVFGLIVPGGGKVCASLDVAGAPITVEEEPCLADAGTLKATELDICVTNGGSATLTAIPDGNAVVPEGFSLIYVLTKGEGLVIEQVNTDPTFTVSESGLFTIHTFVFPSDLDLSIVEFGVTTGFDVNSLLIQGGGELCAALDVAGAQFTVANPFAGTLTADESTVTLSDGSATISATPNGDVNVPEGYSSIFVLTQGEELVIVNVGGEPNFEVTEAGNYTIHTFVFPSNLDLSIVELGVTTGFDVFGLIVPGGGEVCASLDVAGAAITVEEEPCLADAGTLKATELDICVTDGGSATLTAIPDGNAVVPEGFSLIYVLTQGEGLVIEQVNTDPTFTVNESGLFTIHTFVFPSDLDLSIVEFGVTTGFDVNSLLIQGGGELCAALDVAGAQFTVANPFAGTLTADESTVTLSDGSATISATPNGDVNVPEGYSSIFVLTQGEELVIVNVGGEPSFEVTEAGNYTIHTFVFPSDLDLSIVELGVTTGFDVFGLIVPGGGQVCADLDVKGAPIAVEDEKCIAYAGTLHADSPISCLSGGSASISASFGNMPNIPEGFQQLFVLTNAFNLRILAVSETPEFTVNHIGFYRIHSLVYNPNTLDLSIVQFGVTTGFDVNSLLIQGGGSICGSLDVHGALNLVLPRFVCNLFHRNAEQQRMPEDLIVENYFNSYNNFDDFMEAYTAENLDASVSPNPTRDIVKVDVTKIENELLNYQVTDISGRLFRNGSISNQQQVNNIDLSGLKPGTYIVTFKSDLRTFSKKIYLID
jgi:hypothetical protein